MKNVIREIRFNGEKIDVIQDRERIFVAVKSICKNLGKINRL